MNHYIAKLGYIFVGNIPNMSLVEIGREENHPKPSIENAMEKLSIYYSFSGKRIGSKGKIELHVTSKLIDKDNILFLRKCRYLGDKNEWETCIRSHIIKHMLDLGIGYMLVQSLMGNFKVDKQKVLPLEE